MFLNDAVGAVRQRLKVPLAIVRLLQVLPFRGKTGPEDQLGIAVANALRAWTMEGRLDGVWFHVPNQLGGGRKNAGVNYGLAKALGLVDGAADLMFMWATGSGCIELKSPKGTQSPAQKNFEEWCSSRAIPYRIAKTLDEVEMALKEWGILLP